MFIFFNTFDADTLNPMTSFVDPMACEVVRKIRTTSMFVSVHPCVAEVQNTVIPEPVACEGTQCHQCYSSIIRIAPMECCEVVEAEAEAEDADEADEAEEAEEAFDAYIDAVLDQDYDY